MAIIAIALMSPDQEGNYEKGSIHNRSVTSSNNATQLKSLANEVSKELRPSQMKLHFQPTGIDSKGQSYFHYYAMKTKNGSIIIVKSNEKLQSSKQQEDATENELAVLFDQIEMAFVTADSDLSFTIENIRQKPQDYMKNSQIREIQDTQSETKKKMVENLEKISEREEHINNLTEKTKLLEIHTEKFEQKAKDLNSCCGPSTSCRLI